MKAIVYFFAFVVVLVSSADKYDWHCKKFDTDILRKDNDDESQANSLILINMSDCNDCNLNVTLIFELYVRFARHWYDLDLRFITMAPSDSDEFKALTKKAKFADVVSLAHKSEASEVFSQGRIFIFDQCSRLTFKFPAGNENNDQMFVNSVQQQKNLFAFLKAAILATYNDEICGDCEDFDDIDTNYLASYQIDYLKMDNSHKNTTSPTPIGPKEALTGIYKKYHELDQNDHSNRSYVVPLTVVFPSDHVHYNAAKDRYEKYEYIVLNTNDTGFYHDHLVTDGQETVKKVQVNDEIYRYVTNDDVHLKVASEYVEGGLETYDEVEPIYNSEVITPTTEPYNSTLGDDDYSLFNYMKQWMSYKLRK